MTTVPRPCLLTITHDNAVSDCGFAVNPFYV